MSNYRRAILIGVLGPCTSGVGILWIYIRALLSDPDRATLRYFLFDAPHLVIGAGILTAIICVPVALEVALSSREEVEIPVFEPQDLETAEDARAMPLPAYGQSASDGAGN